MKGLRILLVIALAALGAECFAQSQPPRVWASVEPDTIRIGDRFTFSIEVVRDMAQVANFPQFRHETREGEADIELVEALPVDTLKREGRILHLRKRYHMQAFDEGVIHLGRGTVLYADKNIVDTLYGGDSIRLVVAPLEIDSAAMAAGVRDIKPQKSLDFKFGEVSGYALWGLIALLLLAAAWWFIRRELARRGKKLGDLFKPAPPLPPHVVAIRALEALHHRKLWQNGNFKAYYSGLTDILRTYLAGRYGIGAMEMTSDEIIEALRSLSEEELPKKSSMDLTSILRDGDLVKFAKFEPDPEQNERDYTKAYYFVEETKLQEEEPSEGEGIENA